MYKAGSTSSKSVTHFSTYDDDDYEDEPSGESSINWSNLIFLPFHPVFKFLVLLSVIAKSTFGPLQAVYPIIYCSDVLDYNIYLFLLKYFYMYCSDVIYGIDTCLHIMHRQVTDEAMRREFLPKSAFLLLIDLLCIIPFFHLMSNVVCTEVEYWPNMLSFIEFITIYRVAEYFSLLTTHDNIKLCVGYTIMNIITVNCITCVLMLMTYVGLCDTCTSTGYYKDWRKYIMYKLNETDETLTTYVYGASFIFFFPVNYMFDEIKASTLVEYAFFSALMIFFYLISTFVIFPKMIAESLLKLHCIFSFHPRVQIIIGEAKRRNPSPKAYIDVKNFYALMWKKHDGITRLPNIMSELPRYLRVEIKQDLVWAVFYHSPTLRRTSRAFQKWLCDFIHLDYKLPGSRFFVGPHCQSHLYYIKTGIVQLISTDDGITPIISFTSGTIIGDISFFLSPAKRIVMVRCLTYCEVYYLPRADILKALHKFPVDRKAILQRVKDKIKHAHTLYSCKKHVRGLDRAEDEGIAWLKKRWWEISEVVSHFNLPEDQHSKPSLKLSAEEVVYHCPKYLGQLVLCTDGELRKHSLFASVRFPILLLPNSSFSVVWNRIVVATVFLVLIFYPPNITRPDVPVWFNFFQFWVDIVYLADVCVSLITTMENQETGRVYFASVMFARFKSVWFFIDILSATWFETYVMLIGMPQYYYTVQFNRLLKIYVLFPNWSFGKDPLIHVILKVCLIHLIFVYIMSYLTLALITIIPDLSLVNFYGDVFCDWGVPKNKCIYEVRHVFEIFLAWVLEFLFSHNTTQNLTDVYVSTVTIYCGFLIFIYCKTSLIGIFHAYNTGVSKYQFFVINVTNNYKQFKIHPELLRRLNRYMKCHWKYYKGMDVLYPNILKNEPYDIYWKVHGEVAEKIIRQSLPFQMADNGLIRELAYNAKFILLPKLSTVIIFGLQPKNVTWLVQGYIKSEYNNEGELVRSMYKPGDLLAFPSVFFNKPPFRTYMAYTECEVLFINRSAFFKILERYPLEWSIFKNCMEEFKSRFGEMTQGFIETHREIQKKHRRLFHSKHDERHTNQPNETSVSQRLTMISITPTSPFWHYWMLLRVIVVCVSIISRSLQGGIGAYWRSPLMIAGAFCDGVGLIDIILKLFMPYYDHRGLLITDFRCCLRHYLTGTFLMDAIGLLPIYEIYIVVMSKVVEDDDALIINTFSRFAHLYIVIGYFDYLADTPTANIAYIMMFKWQLISVLVMFAVSHYFIKICINFNWDANGGFINATLISRCWLPSHTVFDNNTVTYDGIGMIFAQSLNFAQNGLLRIDLGNFEETRKDIGTSIVLLLLGCSFWFVLCYNLTLLVLHFRGNTIYQHGVFQLKRFLEAERVDEKLIDYAQEHFKYIWKRTKGTDVHNLMSDRIGVAFRQDLSYYFYKQTFTALNSVLQGGEQLERNMAAASRQMYFLPGQELLREMDLTPWVCVVHRGNIIVKRNEEKLAVLEKGAIFGQLDGIKPRPVRVSAEADGYADVLVIPIADFQEALNHDARANLERHIKQDFMALNKPVVEDPHNTVQYILRGRKSLKLPWMTTHMEANIGTRYAQWLFLTWLIEPVISSTVVLTLETVDDDVKYNIVILLAILDVIHLFSILSKFFSAEMTVVDGKCIMRLVKHRRFLRWGCYCDMISLFVPLLTFLTGNWWYQLARLLRLRLLYEFHSYFCTGFQSRVGPIILKFLSVILVLHAMTCGWIIVACRDEVIPIKVPPLPPDVNATIDYSEWSLPQDRKGGGCARMTKSFLVNGKVRYGFIVPKTWAADYIVSMTYILVLYTSTEMESVVSLSEKQVYYKIVINFVIYLMDIWILSIAVSAVYTKLNDLYKYDYKVMKFLTFLKNTGLSPTLLQAVDHYTRHLWQRQRGKMIVQEGDIYPCIYFIHEGEVEKWGTDKSGEKKLLTVLTTNDYFGFIPGLFPNSPFLFSYISRTVVDIVSLTYKDWQDLLQGYPKVKYDLYTAAKQFKKEIQKIKLVTFIRGNSNVVIRVCFVI
ncbi:PREDICTED: uncharacterized protein LOC106107699 isoform X2 [Papilio polytes]|uniref:uncharacterized protein LOC106107699 isoform X2 n=1 Tax=Papilio polytes TaxID=76194 RepID=UPI000676740E|nr:PREDICTED: uncharacterized protein LOC106107699 isoform X2 [Papilio polytes]